MIVFSRFNRNFRVANADLRSRGPMPIVRMGTTSTSPDASDHKCSEPALKKYTVYYTLYYTVQTHYMMPYSIQYALGCWGIYPPRGLRSPRRPAVEDEAGARVPARGPPLADLRKKFHESRCLSSTRLSCLLYRSGVQS